MNHTVACKSKRTYLLKQRHTYYRAMFIVRLRSAYTGFRLLNVSKLGTMPKGERSRSAMQQRCSYHYLWHHTVVNQMQYETKCGNMVNLFLLWSNRAAANTIYGTILIYISYNLSLQCNNIIDLFLLWACCCLCIKSMIANNLSATFCTFYPVP